MKTNRLRLGTFFLLLLSLIAMLPLLLTALGTDFVFERNFKKEASRNVQLFATSFSETLNVFFDPVVQTLSEILYYYAQEEYEKKTIAKYISLKLLSRNQFENFYVLDSKGVVELAIPTNPDVQGNSLRGYEFFLNRSGDGYIKISSPFTSPHNGQVYLTASTSYFEKTIVGYINLSRLDLMLAKFSVLPKTSVMILDRQGSVVAGTRSHLAKERRNLRTFEPVARALDGETGSRICDFEGEPSICGTALTRRTGWIVAVLQPLSVVRNVLVLTRRMHAAIFGIALLLSLAASWGLVRTILRPIMLLQETVRNLAEGSAEPGAAVDFGFKELDEMMDNVGSMALEIRRREAELNKSREFLLTTLRSIGEAAMVADPAGRILFMNPEAERLTGKKNEEALGRFVPEVVGFGGGAAEGTPDPVRTVIETERPTNSTAEYVLMIEGGGEMFVEYNAAPIRETNGDLAGVVVVFRDVTGRIQRDRRIKASLAEKESLLKEVHHRVKNNLQIISSLLGLQENKIKNSDFSALIRESQNRVRTMALVHEKIYRSESLSEIDLGEYLRELGEFLSHAYFSSQRKVTFRSDTVRIAVSIDLAVPCGLLLNEIISNSLKHAFPPDKTNCEIFVQLALKEGFLEIEVGDNGKGLPEGFDIENAETLGLNLIVSLSRQLQADLKISSGGGTVYSLRIPLGEK